MEEYLTKLDVIFEKQKPYEGQTHHFRRAYSKNQRHEDTIDNFDKYANELGDLRSDVRGDKSDISNDIKQIDNTIRDISKRKKETNAGKTTGMSADDLERIKGTVAGADKEAAELRKEKEELRKERGKLPTRQEHASKISKKYNDDYKSKLSKN
jgi:predicted  nucleic acid-binding Zn-ribbon protein